MKSFFLFGILIILTTAVFSQDVTVDAEYPSTVNAGEQFSITWTANTGEGNFEAPPFDGFVKIMGPQTSYSSSTQIYNGKMSQKTTYSYTYYLRAEKEGKFVIPPAKYVLKRKTYASQPLNIEVVNASQNAAPSTGSEKTDQGGSDLFLSLLLNRKEVFIGEHILATVKIFTKVTLSGINEIKYPSFNSFIKSDLQTPPLTSLREENINGTIYGAGVVQQFLLYPQVTGEIEIDPVQMSVLVQQKTGQSDPFFGDFFSSYQTVHRVLASPVNKIVVKPLPGTKPDDFSGVVGKLDMKATLNKDTVNVNDAVNLKITITGTGNLKIAAAPKLMLPPDIEIYDPRISDELENTASGTSGTKTFEYLLIPRKNGDFTIPSITYSYFNPEGEKFENLTTQVFNMHAIKGDDQGKGITVYGGVAREDVKYLGKDIRFLKSEMGRIRKSSNLLLSRNSFYSAYAIGAFAFLLVLLVRKEHVRRNSDQNLVRTRKAAKVAGRRLRAASACLRNNQIDSFHDEILKAVWGYLSDKLNIPIAGLNRNNAASSLRAKGISDEKIDLLTTVLDTCEYARFAPASTGNEAEKIYNNTLQFIKSVENSI